MRTQLSKGNRLLPWSGGHRPSRKRDAAVLQRQPEQAEEADLDYAHHQAIRTGYPM